MYSVFETLWRFGWAGTIWLFVPLVRGGLVLRFWVAPACVLMQQDGVVVFIVGVSLVTARMSSKVSLFCFAVPCDGGGIRFVEVVFVAPQGEMFLVYRMSVAGCFARRALCQAACWKTCF